MASPPNAPDHGRFQRLTPVLGLFSAVALVVGEMIGGGIFLNPGPVDKSIGGHVGLILSLWVACGLVNLCGALALAELVAMFPQEGGTYVFLREAYGRLWSFLWCWTEFWVIRTGAIATLAVFGAVWSEQTALAIGWSIDPDDLPLVQKGVAIGLIALLGGVNVAGTLWGGRVQNVMTTIKVSFVVFLALLPWLALGGKTVPWQSPWPARVDQDLLVRIGAALAAIMWAYDGWGNVTVLAEELREPERTIPRALVGGVLLVTLLYLGANVAYHLTLSVDQIAASSIPAVEVARLLLPDRGEALVFGMLMVSLAGALNGNILVGPRVVFAVSRDHRFLSFFNRLSPRTQAPVRATVAMCTWAIVLILLADVGSQTDDPLFQRLMNYCVFGGSIFYLSAVLAVFVLRVQRPDAVRPYRTWGYPVLPAVFVGFYFVFIVNLFVSRPRESSVGLLFILAGLLVYRLLAQRPAGTKTDGPASSETL
ncbi:MAG TPA: amino acid permease [Pirellulales bacterium]|nr:amino acid permease [Pirellulales bacterium]